MAEAAKITENLENFKTDENFAEIFEKTANVPVPEEGTIVKGTIVQITHDFVTVDIGSKMEGRIPLKEFYFGGEQPELEIGDEVDVYLERFENRQGDMVLSRERALHEQNWDKLEGYQLAQEPVEGFIFGQVKGGFVVDMLGCIAFLPGSQVDTRPIKDASHMLNERQPFMVLKMDKRRGNIVVSRRAIIEGHRNEARNELLSTLKKGDEMEGTIKNLTSYGAFVDLGGLDGLVHTSDISWKRVTHPSEVLSVNQTVKCVITEYDDETKRISLGIKQLTPNPWNGIEAKYPIGTKVKGKVTTLADHGIYVALDEEIEGLAHLTELSWTERNPNPSSITKVGEEVEVQVLDIDMDKHRVSLGLKHCLPNPWQGFADSGKVGDIIKGEVSSVSDFGFFVKLPSGIEGLVHYSDITWDDNGDELLKGYKKGQEVEAKILEIDVSKERVSLGIKQLDGSDPFTDGDIKLEKNEVVTATVTDVKPEGLEVTVADKLKVFIRRADLSLDRGEQRPDKFTIGDRIDAKITNVNKAKRSISLSIKALEIEEQKKAIQEYGSTDSGASLGDILGEALGSDKK